MTGGDGLDPVGMRSHLDATGTTDRVRRLLLAPRDGVPVATVITEAERAGRLPEVTAVLTGLLVSRLTAADLAALTAAQARAVLDADGVGG